MALWTRREFATLDQAMDYLNGAVTGTLNINGGADVDGLTFIVNDGTANRTTTFNPAKGRPWTVEEIVTAINAAMTLGDPVSAVVKTSRAGGPPIRYLRVVGDPDHTVRGNGTANAALGFAGPATPANDTVQVKIIDTAVAYFNVDQDPNRRWVVVHYS